MKSFRDLGVVAACGALALGLVVLLARASPEPKRASFDARPLVRMKRDRPSVVLLGNSMVYTRFDSRLLNKLVHPVRVEVIAVGGSKSAVWYAQIKHTVVASGLRPLRLVLFFRDRELTQLVNNDGGDPRRLERAARGTDRVIERKLAPRADASFALGRAFTALMPVERLRVEWWERVDRLAIQVSTALVDGPPEKSRKVAINRLFGVDALRQDAEKAAPVDQPTKARDFESSFLPDMFDLARRHGIALTFARVRTRGHAMGRPDSQGAARYQQRLRAYIKKQGGTYLDLTANEWERESLYGSGDHIAKPRRAGYTRRFVREYPELFREPP